MLTEEVLEKIREWNPKRLVVAFSGGMDSHALLHAVVTGHPGIPVHALHVNHGINPHAAGWQAHCESVCKAMDVGYTAIGVSVVPGPGVEERARDARYEAFVDFLEADDLLLLGHHADDQVETVLLTLFRGSNRPGVSGMPVERPVGKATLLRPLLAVGRETIRTYAVQHGLAWIEDQSNDDEDLNRNYIRHSVLPVIRERWPDVGKALLNALDRDSEFIQLIDIIGENDLSPLLSSRGGVSVTGLKSLQPVRRKNLLRYWVECLQLPIPGEAVLSAGLDSILGAGEDSAPLVTWQGVCLRRADGELFLTRPLADCDPDAVLTFPGDEVIDTGLGELSANVVKGRGLHVSSLDEVTVRFRRGGERIRLGRNRTLKNVFQESATPSWLRDCVPLVYKGDELVAIAGLPDWCIAMRIASGYEASRSEQGFEISFRVPGHPYTR